MKIPAVPLNIGQKRGGRSGGGRGGSGYSRAKHREQLAVENEAYGRRLELEREDWEKRALAQAKITNAANAEASWEQIRQARAVQNQNANEARFRAMHPQLFNPGVDRYGRPYASGGAQDGIAAQGLPKSYVQMKEVADRATLQSLQRNLVTQDAIASAIALSGQNGGRLPDASRAFLNRQFGFDGTKQGIRDAGIDPKTGAFGVVMAQMDDAGNVALSRHDIPKNVMYGIMQTYPSMFGQNQIASVREALLNEGMSSDEIDAMAKVATTSRAYLQRRIGDITGASIEQDKLASRERLAKDKMRSDFVGNAMQNVMKTLRDNGVADDKIGEMVQSQLSSLLEQYDRAMGNRRTAGGAQASKGDGTILDAAGGAPGSGGKGRATTPQYGLRNDGKTYKGTGWLGELKLPNGGVATEYTMQSDAVRDANGNRIDFPTLVPTLTRDEIDLMVNDIIPNNKPVPDAIAQKAVDFARERMSRGQSVFANDGKQPVAEQTAEQPTQEEIAAEVQRRRKAKEKAKSAAPAQDEGASAPETPGRDVDAPESYEEWLASEAKAGRKATYNGYLKYLKHQNG